MSWPGAEAPCLLKGAKVSQLPKSGAAIRDHFPNGPMQKAMTSLPWRLGPGDEGEHPQVVGRIIGQGHQFHHVRLRGQHLI